MAGHTDRRELPRVDARQDRVRVDHGPANGLWLRPLLRCLLPGLARQPEGPVPGLLATLLRLLGLLRLRPHGSAAGSVVAADLLLLVESGEASSIGIVRFYLAESRYGAWSRPLDFPGVPPEAMWGVTSTTSVRPRRRDGDLVRLRHRISGWHSPSARGHRYGGQQATGMVTGGSTSLLRAKVARLLESPAELAEPSRRTSNAAGIE